ncbi:MAG: hypothetical protein V4603_14515 [Pseudomonadota bacterium]
MTGNLQQLNISYHPVQDRLLLRVNAGDSGEFRIWFTRRYTELLVTVLIDLMEKEGGMRELASHRDTVSQFKQGAFEKEYESPPTSLASPSGPPPALPLGADGVLAFRINANRQDDGTLTLQLLPEQGQGLNLQLNRSLLYMLYNLLEQGLAQAHWNIHLPRTHTEPVH